MPKTSISSLKSDLQSGLDDIANSPAEAETKPASPKAPKKSAGGGRSTATPGKSRRRKPTGGAKKAAEIAAEQYGHTTGPSMSQAERQARQREENPQLTCFISPAHSAKLTVTAKQRGMSKRDLVMWMIDQLEDPAPV